MNNEYSKQIFDGYSSWIYFACSWNQSIISYNIHVKCSESKDIWEASASDRILIPSLVSNTTSIQTQVCHLEEKLYKMIDVSLILRKYSIIIDMDVFSTTNQVWIINWT